MQSLIFAIQFLTRLPTPQVKDFNMSRLAASARWFPLVGLIIGAVLLAIAWPASCIDPWFAAWAALLGWTVVTGGLHLDGLADVSDALGASHRDKEKLLAVLKDPHLGSFGVLTLIMHLSGKLILLMIVLRGANWAALVLIPAWARLGLLFWQTLPPLASGYGKSFSSDIPKHARWLWLALLVAVSIWLAMPLLIAPFAIWLYRHWLQTRVGGMTGDFLGAGVELVEIVLLASLLIGLVG